MAKKNELVEIKKSGVLALSGVSSDFRDIEGEAEKGNEDCQLALDKFAYEVRKYIGAYAAALGGLDCLVFTAGVGENSASMRARICEGLEYLGVKIDPEKNTIRGKEAIISADDSKVSPNAHGAMMNVISSEDHINCGMELNSGNLCSAKLLGLRRRFNVRSVVPKD